MKEYPGYCWKCMKYVQIQKDNVVRCIPQIIILSLISFGLFIPVGLFSIAFQLLIGTKRCSLCGSQKNQKI